MVIKASTILLMLVFSTAAFPQIQLRDNGLAKEVKLYTSGNIESEGYYKNGSKSGKWTYYFENGSKKRVEYYDLKGLPNGKWTNWYENGQKWNTVNYNKGEVHGRWTYWYRNGNKWHQLLYANGEVNGKWTFWLENGTVNDSGRYAGEDTAVKG